MKLVMEHETRVTEAVPGVLRVDVDGETVGYVLVAGTVFVSLRGSVYNTSFEIAQSLDRDAAVRALTDA